MSDLLRTVESYLALFSQTGDEPAIGRTERLAIALDALASAYHAAPNGPFVNAERNPPKRDFEQGYKQLRAAAVAAFPDFGYYACVKIDAVPPSLDDCMIGDAIDDLADIAGDLGEVAWRWHNNGAPDATWHFRNLYEIHWGRHLHDLRSYVHFKLRGH